MLDFNRFKFSSVGGVQSGHEFHPAKFLFVSLNQCGEIAIFSERSLYAIARPSVCLSSVVCRMSVICNVRAPYSGGSNFRQYFYLRH